MVYLLVKFIDNLIINKILVLRYFRNYVDKNLLKKINDENEAISVFLLNRSR